MMERSRSDICRRRGQNAVTPRNFLMSIISRLKAAALIFSVFFQAFLVAQSTTTTTMKNIITAIFLLLTLAVNGNLLLENVEPPADAVDNEERELHWSVSSIVIVIVSSVSST
jgi:hypothetical protein